MGWASVGQEKARSEMGALLGKGRKPWWPALIFADSQFISAAGSGPPSLAIGDAEPGHGILNVRAAALARPCGDRRTIPTPSGQCRRPRSSRFNRGASGSRPMKVASIKSANCRSAAYPSKRRRAGKRPFRLILMGY